MARGKKYLASVEKIDKTKNYSVEEAVKVLRDAQYAKFDESVELHIRLGVDPRNAEQQVRGTVALPHGTGKTIRVLVIAQGDKVGEAEAAGADVVGVLS